MEDEAELRRQILQLEFQHKKEIAEIRGLQAKTENQLARVSQLQMGTQQQLDHITQLTGFAFEELKLSDQKMREAGEILSR